MNDSTDNSLRVVIFTRPELSACNDVLFRRLIADPGIDVAAIVVDCKPWATRSFMKRLRAYGPGYLFWKIGRKAREKTAGLLWKIWLRDHPVRPESEPSWERLARETGVTIHQSPDLHDDATVVYIRSLDADLGVICGGRIIQEKILKIPRYGTLNIHKRKAPDYRGGGAIGYWELLNGESEIAVTIHYAVARVDEGAILAQRAIPIEPHDTLASLRIKANVAGGELYYQTIKAFAEGKREDRPQDAERGKTYRGAGEYAEALLERDRIRRQEDVLRSFGGGKSFHKHAWRWLKYVMQYPLLIRRRNELVASGQAPIMVLFYHRISNDLANRTTVTLEDFVAAVELIRRHFPIISIEEAARRLESGVNREIAFVITFDDGYRADLETSIPWLRYFGIPATFFISIGQVLEQKLFAHDEARGITTCPPMTVAELKSLADGSHLFRIGSHAWMHENCGGIEGAELERAIVASKTALGEVLGREPEFFAFPKGQKGRNIKRASWELAAGHYRSVCSAYSGFNFPRDGCKHIKRWGSPSHPIDVIQIMDGYTGLRDLKSGNLWTRKTSGELPY